MTLQQEIGLYSERELASLDLGIRVKKSMVYLLEDISRFEERKHCQNNFIFD
jgi:hypothetical protein